MINKLKPYFTSYGEETCGFILEDGEVIQVKNIAEDPYTDFQVSEADLEKYEDVAVATWHTHPKSTCNLSVEDYACYLCFPQMVHYIFDGTLLAKYSVQGEFIMVDEVIHE